MSLNEHVTKATQEFFLDNAVWVLGLFVLTLFVVDYYNRFLKFVNTNHIDLVERYVWLKIYRRYKKSRVEFYDK